MARNGMTIVDLDPDDPRLESDVLPVLRELRPHLTAETLAVVYREGYRQGLRFTAAYEKDRCVGVSGWRLVANTSTIKKLYIDDLVTTENRRSRGVGRLLLAELTKRARAAGCQMVDLDSGIQRAGAHRFYMREGLSITSLHFGRRID
jgi:GNAT superfamily N-acetyltransferase